MTDQRYGGQRLIEFRNDSSETAPAFGVLRPTGVDVKDGRPIVVIGKPDSFGGRPDYLINGPAAVASGGYGAATNDLPTFAIRSTAIGTAAGQEVGPVAGEWGMSSHSVGFTTFGDTFTDARSIVWVFRQPMAICLGKTNAAISKSTSGSVSVYTGTTQGSEGDTGIDITCLNRYADLEADVWVRALLTMNGWELFVGECE